MSRRRKKRTNKKRMWLLIGIAVGVIGIAALLGILFDKDENREDKKPDNQTEQVTDSIELEEEPEEPVLTEEEILEQKVDAILAEMTVEDKIYQMFIVTPEALTGYGSVTAAGNSTRSIKTAHRFLRAVF